MHSWYTQKLNELTALADYCQFPVLKAHFILSQQAVDEVHGEHATDEDALKRILPLLAMQAETLGESEAAEHLKKAMQALAPAEPDNTKVIPLDFNTLNRAKKLQGA